MESPVSEHFHAVVWIDHHKAHVIHFNADSADETVVHATDPHSHGHHKANTIGSGHAPEDQAFLHSVVQQIGGAGAVLIVGPSNEKHELLRHIEQHDAQLGKRVSAVQAMDHPTDGQLLAYARKYFHGADRMASQRS